MNTKVLLAVGLLASAVVIGVTSFKQTMTPYIGFSEARAASGQVQVNGVLADKNYVPVAEAATVQVAASVIVTAILTPLLTSWWYRRVRAQP
mgnify:CR=1 FL=1